MKEGFDSPRDRHYLEVASSVSETSNEVASSASEVAQEVAQEVSQEVAETAKEVVQEVASNYSDSLSPRGYYFYSSMKAAGHTEETIKDTIDNLSKYDSYSDLKK